MLWGIAINVRVCETLVERAHEWSLLFQRALVYGNNDFFAETLAISVPCGGTLAQLLAHFCELSRRPELLWPCRPLALAPLRISTRSEPGRG